MLLPVGRLMGETGRGLCITGIAASDVPGDAARIEAEAEGDTRQNAAAASNGAVGYAIIGEAARTIPGEAARG